MVKEGVGVGGGGVVGVEAVEEGVEASEADGVHAFGLGREVVLVDLEEEHLRVLGSTLREWSSVVSASLQKMFMRACATESIPSLLSELGSTYISTISDILQAIGAYLNERIPKSQQYSFLSFIKLASGMQHDGEICE